MDRAAMYVVLTGRCVCVCVCVCADLDSDAAGSVHCEGLSLHPRQAKDFGDPGTPAQPNAHSGSQSTSGR